MPFAVRGLPRILTHHRAFSACVIASLGVGISAAAAVVAVVDSMRHAPLPFKNGPRTELLFMTRHDDPNFKGWAVAQDVARALATSGTPVADVATFSLKSIHVRDGEHVSEEFGVHVSPNFPALLGPRMALGRAFGRSDAGTPTVMLSYAFWTSTLASDSTIVGRTIDLDGTPTVVTGIAAREWDYPQHTTMWVADPSVDDPSVRRRDVQTLVLLDRPVDDQVRATVSTRATAAYYAAKPWHGSIRPQITVRSMPLRDYFTTGMAMIILILSIIATFIGLLAAVNFAALVLARGIRRRGEIGVRAALGASVRRLTLHIIGECLVLCAMGGALAALLAPSFIGVVRATFESFLPAWLSIALSWRTIGWSMLLAVGIGVIFGVGPALDIARPALRSFLSAAGNTSSDSSGLTRTRSRLVAIQVALATAVLVSLSAILGKSLLLTRADTGFAHENLATAFVSDAGNQLSPARGAQLLDQVRSVPVVAEAGFMGSRLVSGLQVHPADTPSDESSLGLASVNQISPGFFAVMRPRIVSGRLPTLDEEMRGAAIAVVTRELSRAVFGSVAVGRRLLVPGYPNRPLTIVGVIADVQLHPYTNDPTPTIYVPAALGGLPSTTALQNPTLWLRAAGSPGGMIRAVQVGIMHHQFTVGRISYVRSIMSDIDRDYLTFRVFLRFVGGVFGIAISLAALGIYGLVAYTAETRARELAIREAVGASRFDVSGLVLRSAFVQGAFGVAAGAILSTLIIGWLNHFDLHLKAVASTSALSVAIVGITILVSSIGPLRATWRRDLASVLRV